MWKVRVLINMSLFMICATTVSVVCTSNCRMNCIVLYCGRVPTANAPGCTAA